jgi:hypothetical protein
MSRLSFHIAAAVATLTLPLTELKAQEAPAAPSGASPAAAAALTTLEKVCLPLLRGEKLKDVSAATGIKERRGEWSLPIADGQTVVITPPSGANNTVCSAKLSYAVGAGQPITQALDHWASASAPPLQKVKDGEETKGPLRLRKTTSWFGPGRNGATIGVVLSEEKDLQGRPAGGDVDEATLLVSRTKS